MASVENNDNDDQFKRIERNLTYIRLQIEKLLKQNAELKTRIEELEKQNKKLHGTILKMSQK